VDVIQAGNLLSRLALKSFIPTVVAHPFLFLNPSRCCIYHPLFFPIKSKTKKKLSFLLNFPRLNPKKVSCLVLLRFCACVRESWNSFAQKMFLLPFLLRHYRKTFLLTPHRCKLEAEPFHPFKVCVHWGCFPVKVLTVLAAESDR
jgi:hypothetical protein